MSGDRHAHLDAAYVLGALSPSERQDFERHLETCADCAQSVREMAGLPGLLSRIDEAEVAALGDRPPLPATLLPALLDRAVVRRSRRRVLVAVGALAAAALVAVMTLAVAGAVGGPEQQTAGPQPGPTATSQPAGATMTQLGQSSLEADVLLQDVAWGTRMKVTCTYYGTSSSSLGPLDYALVVHTRSGRVEQVGTWRAVPGKAMTFEAATATRHHDIASVEIRSGAGTPLLRLAL